MDFQKYYVVILRKGPAWTAASTPELDALQARHLAHLTAMFEMGKLTIAGPATVHAGADDIRGFSFFRHDAFADVTELQALVEQDPMFQNGRLVADYLTWFSPAGATLSGDG